MDVKKLAAWLGVATGTIAVLAFFGINSARQLLTGRASTATPSVIRYDPPPETGAIPNHVPATPAPVLDPTTTAPIVVASPTAASPAPVPGPIANTFSGLCIDTNGTQGPGVQVQVRDCGNFTGQIWKYDEASLHLVNSPSGYCLDTAGAPAKGVLAVLNPCGNYTGQQWQYDASSGHFVNLTSGLCLDTNGPPANDVEVLLNPCGNYTGQGWHI